MAKNSPRPDADVDGQPTMPRSGFEMLTALMPPPLTAMTDMNGRVFEGMTSLAKEWTEFLRRRLAANMALPQQVAACRTTDEMHTVYAQFLQQASAQCLEEVGQLTKINMSMADETLKAMQRLHPKTVRS